ncbi:kinase-like domain-containing protein [Hypoxylon crocopeplum]|nr:kinase-like domain-containing protein [Hypoxylon crocopeplum]
MTSLGMATVVTTDVVPRTVRVTDLPRAEDMVFRDSSFSRKNRPGLPSPQEIREKNIKINGFRARPRRPPPIPFEELGLIVKFGSEITIAEAQCLWYFNRYMKNAVPTPELYGWCRDGGETFIYMELVSGDTLEDAWPSLNQEERDVVCRQLRTSVKAWRSLRQETEPYYIGHIGRQGVGDIIFSDAGDPQAGPFENISQFHDFFARYACRLQPDLNPRRDFPELAGLTDDRPVVFTHGDLDKSNILVSPREAGSPPRVAAIIDWHQSGWYPSDWEWLKARSRCEPLWEGGRDTAWLSQIMAPADRGYQVAWEFINGSLGC